MEKNAMSDEITLNESKQSVYDFKRQLQRIGPNVKERSIPVWVRDPKQTDVERVFKSKGLVREEV